MSMPRPTRHLLARLSAHVVARAGGRADDRERGDVPGWVLVTVMTAGLVTGLYLFAGPKLEEILGDALDGVLGD